MPIALTLDETYEYQLTEDRAPDGKTDPSKTIFTLRALLPYEEAEINDKFFAYNPDGSVAEVRYGTAGHKRLLYALVGWKNLLDKDGQPVAFKTRHGANSRVLCDEENLARLAQRHRGELVRAHREHFQVTADEGN